jgi:acyl-CoA thioesterase-2
VPAPELRSGDVADLVTLLDLEELDRDLYRGRNADHGEPRWSLYGGQVAAQALRAASRTVPDDRVPHSLHGYVLRPGLPDHPVIYRVDRDRDGGSFSARHVRAVQHGEVIFSALASFKVPDPGPTYEQPPWRDVPPPEEVPPSGWDALVETRDVTTREYFGHGVTDSLWCRVPVPLPDDPVLHACVLTYLSDYGGGFVLLDVPDLPLGGPSIDHVIWFHEPVRADQWILVDLRPERASDARGTYLGTLRTVDGTLAAVFAQECLLRFPRGAPRPESRTGGDPPLT